MKKDKAFCKGKVYRHKYPFDCKRREWKDGYCKTHHPDEKRKRIAESSRKKDEMYDRAMEARQKEEQAIIDKDLDFLKEMRDITQSLIHNQYDIVKVERLNTMIEDWIHELENK